MSSTSNAPPRSPLDSGSPSQLWAPPKSPLPPHRLAKLANALGVSTPMPATQPNSPYLTGSGSPYLSHSNSLPTPSSATEFLRRSPTPSASSAVSTYQTPTSKFLLHVIPPLHLLHDFDVSDETNQPPATASGYHTQFQRGTLVPVYPNLQLQLGAIAKEYALPSTMGLILYLVNTNVPQNSSGPVGLEDPGDELGPRLSEDIWKHLWVRVLKAEQRDELVPRSASPNPLGFVLSAKSSPNPNGFNHLRITAPNGNENTTTPYPLTPSSSTTTTTSASDLQHHTHPSTSSISQSEAETPDSSVLDSRRADSLDLPGLNSTSFIPILAKVEFDVDRRKAPWYDPWVRSRKMNQVKRAESRASRKGTVDDASEERRAPLGLKLTERLLTASPISLRSLTSKDKGEVEGGYQQLSDSTTDDTGSDYGGGEEDEDEEDEEEDATARVASIPNGRDPLSDVFGTDEETWAELRNSQLAAKRPPSNPNVVSLALTAADLENLPELPPSDDEDDFTGLTRSEDEVADLLDQMDQMTRPALSVSIPTSPPRSDKHVPPPLVLKPISTDLSLPVESPLPGSSGSAHLAYLTNTSEENIESSSLADEQPIAPDAEHEEHEEDDLMMDEISRVKSPAESEKREGAIFDDLDLGLDLTEEFDENDPNDRRRSQLMMKAQLDEIEKNLAQFSPKALRTDLADTIVPLSPNLSGVLLNSEVLPPTPGLSRLSDTPTLTPPTSGAWPSVPYSTMKDAPDVPQTAALASPSPPRLALNGVSTGAPKSFNVSPSKEISKETQQRQLEMEGQEITYPAINAAVSSTTDSPVIPLSPDPFGRYPSSNEASSSHHPSSYWGGDQAPATHEVDYYSVTSPTESGRPPSSRFSADSTSNEEVLAKSIKNSNSNSLMSVKSLRKLWRKSNKSSISSTPASTSGRSSPAASLSQSARPSEDLSALPALPMTPTVGSFPLPPPPHMQMQPGQMPSPNMQAGSMLPPAMNRPDLPPQNGGGFAPPPPRGSLAPPFLPTQMQPPQRDSTMGQLRFDQESPYPIHRPPAPRYSPRPPSPAYAQPPQQQNYQQGTLAAPAAPEKTSVRKSILKAVKSLQSGGNGNSSPTESQRSSMDRSGPGTRSRRGSVASTNSYTPNMPASDIPPSPRIPEHLLAGMRSSPNGAPPGPPPPPPQDHRLSLKTRPRSNTSSLVRSASPPRSMASSRDSEETRPSFDVSQFEMVSPKMNSTLSYPYHGLDHE
ncbi:hypothetical protein PLEOSDRAFT_1092495 [Pleurotus ostreatus PC15]|uniref:Uncharacterized protein n=1 Tax=Pleurotus ostreatus (strain PC15) TaxID=1137138 RepID=A0A067P5R8_PLEO1|nr:hypothetical protein PLEOSDRAFT_1092495 [Pleurotus ostreatus PC15]